MNYSSTRKFLRQPTLDEYLDYKHIILTPNKDNGYLIYKKDFNAQDKDDIETFIFISEIEFNNRFVDTNNLIEKESV